MAEIKLNKKDIIWSYLAQFLSMGVGIISLPFILNKLSTVEIGLNYILITIGSIIALVDLGFAPQFARNFTYIFSGAQEIKKEGIGETGDSINYALLASLLKTARYIYGILGSISIIILAFIGTPYIYITTNGFNDVPNVIFIWIIYAIGVFFQIFYSYYFSMLLGAGLIKEQKYAIIGNKILYLVILLSGLYLNWGLMSVALAQMLSPFLGRFICYHYFYNSELKKNLNKHRNIAVSEIIKIFKLLWFNAKRTAIMLVGSYAILKFSMFIAGLYTSLEEFASYGLMIQITGIVATVSNTFIQISQPKFASLRAINNKKNLLTSFSIALNIYYILFISGSLILVLWGNDILYLLKSNAILPSKNILIIYCIVIFLEYNHASFASLISSNNNIPFAPASIITGIAVCLGIFLVVKFTNWGIMGLVIVQGVCQLAYQNWKWPQYALKEFNISYLNLLKLGIIALNNYPIKRLF